ncbi:uncharacterized protein LOC119097043 [Pollicipes pollicipes]|uniref:uncharacterized protein LOC119097043 n=1 Tax=Pollicipes pollicipes TaxID=41117 RepID=UPI001884A6F3|nr:uncharacterized protein LOC119097043 [Pollicipes pollicipes]XP_037075959.1 uncharacterized protein LOC119097043 [Pollicipes pollicipes]
MPHKKHHYKHYNPDPPTTATQRDPRAPVGPRGPNDALMATTYRVELNTCHSTTAEKTYRNVFKEGIMEEERKAITSNQQYLQRNADACEGKRFLREQSALRRLRHQLCEQLQLDHRSLLEVRRARMAELVLAEGRQLDEELAQRGLALYDQRI